MDNISRALNDLKQGFAMMRQNAADQRERWLTLLAKWETRLNVQGDDWTWRDFEDTSVARAALEAENLPTETLKARAKRLLKQDEASRSALIQEIEKGDAVGLSDRIRALVAAGADPDGASLLKDVPLAFARDRGIASIFDLLLELGADPSKVGFDALHQAVRFGDLDAVRGALEGSDPLAGRPDADSPLWLAVTRGDPGIVAALLDALAARGQMKDAAVDVSLGLAAQEGRADLVALFLERGADPDTTLDDLTYRLDTDILALYIKHGADVSKLNDLTLYHEDVMNLRDAQGVPKITAFVDMLLAAGWQVDDLDEFEREQIRFVTKAHLIAPQDRNAPGFADTAAATEGSRNPDCVTCAYHLEMARTGVSPFFARKQWGGSLPHGIWTADRFGQSTTQLPDGRWVQIAGEHEDSYDPDFMIFSDVVVHDGAGGMEVYFYPRQIFPPTDFHSASLVGDAIWIIGCTGYHGTRRAGETPVYRLDLADFSISAVQTTGSLPGWIGRHKARTCGDDIVIDGGWIWAREGDGDWAPQSFRENDDTYRLDTLTGAWSRG